MKRRILASFLVACCLAVLLPALGFAACANLAGTWSGLLSGVACDTSTDQCSYLAGGTLTLRVTKQKGCFFYGRNDKSELFQGLVDGTGVRITLANPYHTVLFDGLLTAYDGVTGKYTKLALTGTDFPAPGAQPAETDSDSYKGTLTRSQ